MGNHRMGHHQTRINSTSQKMSKVVVVKIQRQPIKIEVTQPLNVVIPTTGMETVVAPDTNFVSGRVLIGFVANLGHGLGKVSVGRNLSRSLGILTTTIKVVGTPQMVFTNPIMTTHVTTDEPSRSSIVTRGYISTYVENLRRGYRKSSIIIAIISNHINGHFVRPNRVVVKHLDFKKDVDFDVHVKVLTFAMKANAETSEKCIINVFSYTLKNATLD